jgi:iron complex transport system substrate-binding protein
MFQGRFALFAKPMLAVLFLSTVSLLPTPAACAATSYPITVKSGGYTTTLKSKPLKIISLSPTATEILFGIGAGAQVLAVDEQSNFPMSAPKSTLSGFDPNIEAIVAQKPDLVILSVDSAKSKVVNDALTKLGIPVVMEKAATKVSEAYSEIELLGLVTDNTSASKSLVKKMKSEIFLILRSAAKKPKLRFFHELDETLYSATSKTFIGSVYRDFGLKNIADAAKGADKSGYPQITAEFLIKSNPQIIFLADSYAAQSAETVKARAGWSQIEAVKKGKIVVLPADIPSRWGPRIVDFYRVVAEAIN